MWVAKGNCPASCNSKVENHLEGLGPLVVRVQLRTNTPAREEEAYRWYSGIGLHSTNSLVAVINSTGQLLSRRRLPNELSAITAAIGAVPRCAPRRRGGVDVQLVLAVRRLDGRGLSGPVGEHDGDSGVQWSQAQRR